MVCAQARIAARIQAEQIEHNFQQAWEHTPEVFGHVLMLYVNLEVCRAVQSVNVVHAKSHRHLPWYQCTKCNETWVSSPQS